MTDERSPCLECPRKDEDKDECSEHCKRLSAWRREDPAYMKYPVFDGKKKPKLTKQKVVREDRKPVMKPEKCRKCQKHPVTKNRDDGLCGWCRASEKKQEKEERPVTWKDFNRLVTNFDKELENMRVSIRKGVEEMLKSQKKVMDNLSARLAEIENAKPEIDHEQLEKKVIEIIENALIRSVRTVLGIRHD